ncbi:MAG: ABC transporter permease [Bacteroidota bacterium]
MSNMTTSKSPSKIGVIMQHEFLKRIRSKGFIIGTLLGPLAMFAMIAIPAVIGYLSKDSSQEKISILDQTGKLAPLIVEKSPTKYFIARVSEDSLRAQVLSEELTGYAIIPADILKTGKATVFTRGGGGLSLFGQLENAIEDVVRNERLKEAGADLSVIKLVDEGVDLATQKVTETGVEKDFGAAYAIIGYVLGFLIYILMFIYGMMVMRGVMEEKTNRIVEVLASSAKPYDIMMGKILGIGAMGLVQMVIWAVLGTLVSMLAGTILLKLGIVGGETTAMGAQPGQQGVPEGFSMPSISPWLGVAFVFYFLAGYFIYATLFAAVGSAVDQEADAQHLQMPITLPIIIPILFIGNVIADPNGTLATVMSLIPFFTPILMIVRIAATSVPVWQIVLSVILPIITFFGLVWVAARIYRIGIMSYGKKPTFKELAKWVTS